MSDTTALAAAALGLGREPWNDPASRRRGRLQHELRELEHRRRVALNTVGDLEARIAEVLADLEVLTDG